MFDEAKQNIITFLINRYKTNGYVTEDEVFELSERKNFSIFDINNIMDYLLSHGVIISEEKEKITIKKGRGNRRNYTKLFQYLSKKYNGLKVFIKYYDSIDGLAEGEWITLIKQSRYGNDWAKKRLFDTSMKKTIKQAYDFSKKFDVDFEDTLQESAFGISYAINAFDETKHPSFPSYVPLAVNSRLRRNVTLASNPVINFPSYLVNDFLNIYTLVKDHCCSECSYGQNKLICKRLRTEIKEKLNCNMEEIDECLKYLQPIENLQENSKVTEIDLSNTAKEDSIRKYVSSILVHLKSKEEIVIRMRFGIGTDREHTLEEIGQKYNLTRERIRQIEKKALKKLTWYVNHEHIAEELMKE